MKNLHICNFCSNFAAEIHRLTLQIRIERMKKFAYLIMLATAVAFTSCFLEKSPKDNGEQQVETPEGPEPVIVEPTQPKKREIPQEIKDFKAAFEVKLVKNHWTGLKWTCLGSEIKDNNVIVSIEVDESQMPGNGLKEAFEITGDDADSFAQTMLPILRPENQAEKEQLAALHAYEYNVILRLVGNETGEEMLCTITHDMLPR